ncbi:MAG: hypothetical protein WBG58_20000, partial [Ignavibacteriaceae bacterium]
DRLPNLFLRGSILSSSSINGKSNSPGLPFCFFIDFTIYAIDIDFLQVALMARNHNIDFGYKLSFRKLKIQPRSLQQQP